MISTHASPLSRALPGSATSPALDAARQNPRVPVELQTDGQTDAGSPELKEAFQDFVGQTFYGQLIKSMRQTVSKPAYFHGGRTEEVFQAQMDQIFAEEMSDASAEKFTQPMFDLFTLPRS